MIIEGSLCGDGSIRMTNCGVVGMKRERERTMCSDVENGCHTTSVG